MSNNPVAYISKNGVLFKELPPEPMDLEALYTHPVKELTDEEIIELGENTLPNEAIGFVPMWQWIEFARAILRKAQDD